MKNPVVIHFNAEEPVIGDQRVKLYPEGGVRYETFHLVKGWIVEEDTINPILEKMVEHMLPMVTQLSLPLFYTVNNLWGVFGSVKEAAAAWEKAGCPKDRGSSVWVTECLGMETLRTITLQEA